MRAQTATCHPARPHKAHGLCGVCYQRSRRNGTPGVAPAPPACESCGLDDTQVALLPFELAYYSAVGGRSRRHSMGQVLYCERCVMSISRRRKYGKYRPRLLRRAA